MDILVIVTESPWGSSRGNAARRLVRAAWAGGDRVPAVFFRNDGVYHALPGRASDDGLATPGETWSVLGRETGMDLLICAAASARRFPPGVSAGMAEGFTEAGLARMWELAAACDRVVSF